MMPCTTDRPRPVPPLPERVVKNGSKMWRNVSADMPQPLLYLETGRALVDEAGYLVTTVMSGRTTTVRTFFGEIWPLSSAPAAPSLAG